MFLSFIMTKIINSHGSGFQRWIVCRSLHVDSRAGNVHKRESQDQERCCRWCWQVRNVRLTGSLQILLSHKIKNRLPNDLQSQKLHRGERPFSVLSSSRSGPRSISTFILKGKDLDWHYNQTCHHPTTTPPPLNFSKVETWDSYTLTAQNFKGKTSLTL